MNATTKLRSGTLITGPDTAVEIGRLIGLLTATDAALTVLDNEVDPTRERMQAIALEMARDPRNTDLAEEYSRLSAAGKAPDADRVSRRAVLLDRAEELDATIRGLKARLRMEVSQGACEAAVEEALKLQRLATACDKAFRSVITALEALRLAHEPVAVATNAALAKYVEVERRHDVHHSIAGSVTFKSSDHAMAIRTFIRDLIAAAGDSGYLADYVSINPFVANGDRSMVDAVDASITRIAQTLGIERKPRAAPKPMPIEAAETIEEGKELA